MNDKVSVKITVWFVICIFFLGIIFTFVIYSNEVYANKIHLENEINMTGQVKYCIDSIEITDEYITISGWAGKEGQNIELFDTNILLRLDGDQDFYCLRTELMLREDLKEFEGYSFEKGGFVSLIEKKQLEKNKTYHIYIWYKNDNLDLIVPTEYSVEVE